MPCLTIISEKGWLRFDCDVYEQTSLACTFCFPISDHVMPSWEFSFCLFISYVYICTCIRRHLKKLFPRVASRGLKWENKTYKLKRSIVWHRLGNRGLYPRNCFFFNSFDTHSTLSKSLLVVLLLLCFSFFFLTSVVLSD